MRQLILYYTMLIKYGRTDDLQKFVRELGKYKYCSEYFSFWKSEVATYYRMWNIAFLLPSFLRIFYIKAIVVLKKKYFIISITALIKWKTRNKLKHICQSNDLNRVIVGKGEVSSLYVLKTFGAIFVLLIHFALIYCQY